MTHPPENDWRERFKALGPIMVSEDGAWLPKNKAAFFIETEIAKARHEERRRILEWLELKSYLFKSFKGESVKMVEVEEVKKFINQ